MTNLHMHRIRDPLASDVLSAITGLTTDVEILPKDPCGDAVSLARAQITTLRGES